MNPLQAETVAEPNRQIGDCETAECEALRPCSPSQGMLPELLAQPPTQGETIEGLLL